MTIIEAVKKLRDEGGQIRREIWDKPWLGGVSLDDGDLGEALRWVRGTGVGNEFVPTADSLIADDWEWEPI